MISRSLKWELNQSDNYRLNLEDLSLIQQKNPKGCRGKRRKCGRQIKTSES